MAKNEQEETGATGVVLMVCVKCGTEIQLEAGDEPPADLECEKCGSTVFRRFDDTSTPDGSQQEFRDSTERDTDTNDTSEEVTRQDLMDLNNP